MLFHVRALLATLSIFAATTAFAARPADALFPNTTRGFISVRSLPELLASWRQTEVNRVLQDPTMKAFGDDLRRQMQQKLAEEYGPLAITADDIEGMADGEVGMAVIRAADERAAFALLIEVRDHTEQARSVLDKMAAKQTKRGARRSQQVVGGVTLTVFDLPAKEKVKHSRQAIYFLHGGLLGASDNLATLSGIVKRMTGSHTDTLATVTAYQKVLQRCQVDAGTMPPQMCWFVEPIAAAEAMRSRSEAPPAKGVDMLKVLKRQGFTGIRGVGGFVNFSSGPYEMLHRTAVYAPPPHQLALRMAVFPGGGDLVPLDWVPRDVVSHAAFQWDIQNAFERFSTLFDEVYAKEGVFEDTLESVKTDEFGPQVDIRAELVAHLAGRATVLTDYKLPVGPTSERRLIAVAADDEAALKAAVEKTMKGDPTVKKRLVQGHDAWEIVGDQRAVPPAHLRGGVQAKRPTRPKGQDSILPNSAVTVAKGHLFIASHIDLLDKILTPIEPREALRSDVDYQVVMAHIAKLAPTENGAANAVSLSRFSRSDESLRVVYDLFRQGRLPESDAWAAKLLNSVLGDKETGALRKPQVDGGKLPDYEVVRRYLGPSGIFVLTEPTGWFSVGFTLNKEVPHTALNPAGR